jgi:hypothetical protein
MAEEKRGGIDIRTAQQVIVLANSPNFIFNHLRNDPAVKSVALRLILEQA